MLSALKQQAFTLVELLVVVLIIGLGVSVIGITVNDGDGFKMQTEARNFVNNTLLMGEEAVLGNQPWGVDIYREADGADESFGYRWVVFDELRQEWFVPEGEHFGETYRFSQGWVLRLELEGLEREVDIEYKQELAAVNVLTLGTQFSQDNTRDAAEQEDESVSRLKIIGADNSIVDAQERFQPEIWLLASGEKTAFKLSLFDPENPEALVEIIGDELGRIKLDSSDEERL